MISYNDHVKAIAARVEKILLQEDCFDDDDLTSQVIYGETASYGKTHGWYGPCKNHYDADCEDLLFAPAQMIAGHSPSIELSFNGQYRKDMFRDVAINALHYDILLNLKNTYNDIQCIDFCDRGN
jgi:hypothetical protein